jgi:hypothetical protein
VWPGPQPIIVTFVQTVYVSSFKHDCKKLVKTNAK